jgi:hypothetical protein
VTRPRCFPRWPGGAANHPEAGRFAGETKRSENFACELKNFACETKTLRRRAFNSLKLLANEIVDSAVSVEYQEVGGRFISRSLAPSGLVSFGIRSRSPGQKHHDTDSDFLEEN